MRLLALLVALVLVPAASAQDFRNEVLQAGRIDLHGVVEDNVVTRQPIVNFFSDGTLEWQTALDTFNSLNDDYVLAVRGREDACPGCVEDVIYLRDWDGHVATGFSITPPLPGYRVQVGSPDRSDWGALQLRIGQGALGDALSVQNSAGSRLLPSTVSVDSYRLGAGSFP